MEWNLEEDGFERFPQSIDLMSYKTAYLVAHFHLGQLEKSVVGQFEIYDGGCYVLGVKSNSCF